MSPFRSIVHYLLLSAVALAAMPAANAQVTVHLTTAQGSNCDVTTDAQGLTLVPGGTDLRATGVTLTGAGCGTGTQPPLPSPDNFALNAPASASVGLSFPVSWTVTGATACSGSASLNGNSVGLGGWTDSTSATSPRQVTATLVGTYTLGLICSNAVGSVTSQPTAVVVSGGSSDNCPSTPLTRLVTASIKYPNIYQSPTRPNVDVTQYDNIWGHMNNTDATTPWPGVSGTQPALLNWSKTQYVAAKFHVPAGQSQASYGWQGYGSYYSGPALTLAISTTCGDFAPTNPQCVSTRSGGESFAKWRIVPATINCPLAPNADYFINIKMVNPLSSDCGGSSTCNLATNNTVSP